MLDEQTVRAMSIVAPRQSPAVDVPLREPVPSEARLRVDGCGVCASRLGPWLGLPWPQHPRDPGQGGHEAWGALGRWRKSLGWIGRARPDEALAEARSLAPGARVGLAPATLLQFDLDGVVLATPSSLHAEQSAAALDHAVPVFCQKPVARDAFEAAAAGGWRVDLGIHLVDAVGR